MAFTLHLRLDFPASPVYGWCSGHQVTHRIHLRATYFQPPGKPGMGATSGVDGCPWTWQSWEQML